MPIIYSLEINPLSLMKNVYTALENDQVYNFWIFLFLLNVDYVGTRNRSKMLTAAQSWLSPEELGPDDTSGVKEELDLPSSKSKQSEHVTKGVCTFNSDQKFFESRYVQNVFWVKGQTVIHYAMYVLHPIGVGPV